jgi:uncharacterized membrane protein YcaP (DUF421 family)
MQDLVHVLFGEGSELTIWQMADRAVVVFFITLALIRASGRRSFGQHSPFDSCTTVLLGAILSRAVAGVSPFFPTLAAAVALVLLHRGVALASMRWPWFEQFVSGHERELVREGAVDARAMRLALITHHDLEQAVRQKTGHEDIGRIERAVLERDGQLTVVPRKASDTRG